MGMVLPVGDRGLIAPGMPQVLKPAHFAVPDGLIGYWGFDPDCLDFTNNAAFDLSGNGNHGTLNSLPTSAFRSGQIGGALNFDGSTSYVQIPDAAILRLGNADFSFNVWVQGPTRTDATAYLLGKGGDGSANEYEFRINANGQIQSRVDNATISSPFNSASFTDGRWHQVSLAVIRGVTGITYVDGVQSGSPTSLGAITTLNIATVLFIGRRTSSLFYKGPIDDVRIYNRALSPWEIMALYKAGLAGRRDAGQLLPQDCEMDALFAGVASRRSLSPIGTRAGSRQRQAA